MFKRFTSRILIIILIVLLAVYFVVTQLSSRDRTFKDKILSFDSKNVTEILISDPKAKTEVKLELDGKEWKVLANGKTYNGDTNVVKNILKQLGDLQTKRFAGKGEDAWIKFQVTDTNAIKVTLMGKSDRVAELYIGRFSYSQPKGQEKQAMQQQQPKGEMNTYVRAAEDKEVYAVDGFMRMNFNRDFNSYRNKMLVNVKPNDITRIVYTYPDRKMTLEKQGTKWMVNGMPADSVKMTRYLSTMARLSSANFVDIDLSAAQPAYLVNIEGTNFSPVQVKAFPVADTNINFAISSSVNEGAFFNGKKSDFFKKIMIAEQEVLPAK
jgi:hypothetical protein